MPFYEHFYDMLPEDHNYHKRTTAPSNAANDTAAFLRRYSRHIALEEVGIEGQRRLANARALIIGAGGLGSPALLYCAAAGIGTLGIVDDDTVEESNLQRQILHTTADIGTSKTASARQQITALNPHVEVHLHNARLTSANALDIIHGYDIVLDGTDNFATRYLVNDACYFLQKPLIYGSVYRFQGQLAVFDAARGRGCYRCLYPTPPPPELVPTCAEGGVLGVLPGIVGTLQATEALKILLGIGEPLTGTLLLFNALSMDFSRISFPSNPACPLCGSPGQIRELQDYDTFCSSPPSSGVQSKMQNENITPSDDASRHTTTLHELSLAELREKCHTARHTNEEVLIIDVREEHERTGSRIEPSLHIPLRMFSSSAASSLLNISIASQQQQQASIVLYCASGKRSQQAASILAHKGFTEIYHLRNGINAYLHETTTDTTHNAIILRLETTTMAEKAYLEKEQ